MFNNSASSCDGEIGLPILGKHVRIRHVCLLLCGIEAAPIASQLDRGVLRHSNRILCDWVREPVLMRVQWQWHVVVQSVNSVRGIDLTVFEDDRLSGTFNEVLFLGAQYKFVVDSSIIGTL